MTAKNLTALAATATVALSGFAPAAVLAKATGLGKHTVNQQTYVYHKPAMLFDGTMHKGETIKVERLSKSGKYAYGMAYGHINRHVWISASLLDKKK